MRIGKRFAKRSFFQRPLKSQKHLIGRCELEPQGKKYKHRRCDLCLPVAQEFRILQKVNDLRVFAPGRQNEPLNDIEQERLIEALWTKPDLTWSNVRTLLGLRGARFNFEEWDDKLVGNRTNAKMMEAFGNEWLELPEERQTEIAREILHYRNPEALKRRAMNTWGLDEEAAEKLSRIHLEEDYASHSRQALRKLIDGDGAQKGLKHGVSYATIRRALYPESFAAGKAFDSPSPVCKWKTDIRNPAVIRALTELRKVVNAVVARYGKPATVHIELARDIRNSRKKRKDIWQKNQENQKRRAKAVEDMFKECGIANPRRSQLDKWLLANECNRECPYCGKPINMRSLMGDDAEFNVEHIFPRRYLDDSYRQVQLSQPRRNRLWQQIIRGKIHMQAALLVERLGSDEGLARLATCVRSGDTANVEARAARRYWITLFGSDFRRDRNAAGHNRLLNYGYAVLRASVSRAIVAAGLHPTVGLHHHNRYNSFCLADDLMEPFRPIVDRAVARLVDRDDEVPELTQIVRAELLRALIAPLRMGGELRSLFDGLARTTASLVQCIAAEHDQLELPEGFADADD